MKIVIAIVVLLAGFLVVVALQPDSFRVERSAVISAPAAEIFPYINDLRKMQEWSPWRKLDPDAKMTYDGPASGVGSSVTWAGNSQIGEGRQTITESRPGERVQTRLEFKEPMEGVSTAEIALAPRGNDTAVTWSMFGENNFIGKALCLFMDQDKMIGGSFDEGLAELKALVEKKGARSQ